MALKSLTVSIKYVIIYKSLSLLIMRLRVEICVQKTILKSTQWHISNEKF
jgi:hypothetical protein